MAEPLLEIRAAPARPPLTRVFALGLTGIVVIALTPVLVRPAPPPVTVIMGKMGSKADYFRDDKVQAILRTKRIEVKVDSTGSREVATHDVEEYDFVFPSGQPASDLIINKRSAANKEAQAFIPFVSPIVLATYRPYAQALQDAGVVTPKGQSSANPLYYTLDIDKFVSLTEQGRTWNDIGLPKHGIRNSNQVLAHTSDVCRSNSGGTYQGLIAFAKKNRPAESEAEVMTLAEELRPLYRKQGAPTADRVPLYLAPEGSSIAPIVVIYEHQYLAHQLRQPPGAPDEDRVLLYPAAQFATQPSFVSLNEKGRRLGELLRTDPELRRRAVELGFRVLDVDNGSRSPLLAALLQEHGIEVPALEKDDTPEKDQTRAYLPPLDLFEKLIIAIGGCAS